MKHFLFQSQGHMCVQQRSTVNPVSPIWGVCVRHREKSTIPQIAPCTLGSIHEFHPPRLSFRIQIATVFAAQIFVCHFAVQNSNRNPCQKKMVPFSTLSKPPRKSKLANQIPHCHSKVLRFFLHNEGMVNTCFRCKPNWAHRLLVIQLAT